VIRWQTGRRAHHWR